MSSSNYRWEVPDTSESRGVDYIDRRTKAHLFNMETGYSVCRYHFRYKIGAQDEVEYNGRDEYYCKKCLKKYKKLKEVE